MIIISKGIIHRFAGKHPDAIKALNEWWVRTKSADWNSLHEVKNSFNSCDVVGNDRYVFNIAGNNFRLVAMVHFNIRTIYIRGIFTHPEYERLIKNGSLSEL